MAVMKLGARLWPGPIPYTVASEPRPGFVAAQVAAFNGAVRKALFVPRKGEANYVEFTSSGQHSSCVIGQKGGKQKLSFSESSILHEMGHCVGLGHEHFHTKWPGAAFLLDRANDSIHALAYRQAVNEYADFAAFDPASIMLYPPERLGIPAAHYAQLAGRGYFKPTRLSPGDIFAIRNLAAHVADGVPHGAGAGGGADKFGKLWPSGADKFGKMWPATGGKLDQSMGKFWPSGGKL